MADIQQSNYWNKAEMLALYLRVAGSANVEFTGTGRPIMTSPDGTRFTVSLDGENLTTEEIV